MLLKMGSEMGEKREEARKRFWKREEEIRKEDAAGGGRGTKRRQRTSVPVHRRGKASAGGPADQEEPQARVETGENRWADFLSVERHACIIDEESALKYVCDLENTPPQDAAGEPEADSQLDPVKVV